MMIMIAGIVLWSAKNSGGDRPRLISGRVTVAGRDVSQIPDNVIFDVAGRVAAVIELPGGARIELLAATRAAIRRDKEQVVVQLASGGGDFRVEPDQPSFRVETVLGVVTARDGQFSLDLVLTLPAQVSPTELFELPRLVVVVAQGSVTVQQTDIFTTLSAGQERVFFNHISS
jgi:ferric-dicitrate binding protein FerR (iron transport regulator)